MVLIANFIAWRGIGRILFQRGNPELRCDQSFSCASTPAMLFSLGRRICLAAQFYLGFFPMFAFGDALSAFILVWLYRENAPWSLYALSVLSSTAVFAGSKLLLSIWGLEPFPQRFVEYKPPNWVQAFMFIGSLPFIAWLRSLAK